MDIVTIITKKSQIFDILYEIERHQACIQQLIQVKNQHLAELAELQKQDIREEQPKGE